MKRRMRAPATTASGWWERCVDGGVCWQLGISKNRKECSRQVFGKELGRQAFGGMQAGIWRDAG